MVSSGRKIRGIIFDLDETLISSVTAYTKAFNQGIGAFGLPPVAEEVMAGALAEGRRLADILIELSPETFADASARQSCRDEMIKAYQSLEDGVVQLKPSAEQVLRSLKDAGLKIGIVTGRLTAGDGKWRELRQLKIDHLVDAVVTGAEVRPKPAPDGLLKCLADLGLPAEECVFVGDSKIDVRAALAAGVRMVAVRPEGSVVEDGPVCVLTGLGQLPSCLDGLEQEED
ncbi:MAG: HAD family hydrolase [Chloroflexi bacterium]|nr:HAD family hydrolase [Chloroflexota bacterium]